MSSRTVAAGDAELCTQSFGRPQDPAVLLVHGQMASMLWWDDAFCERLAAGGRFVLRYDHRDTGRSTAYPPGAPAYGSDELAGDVVAVLDGHGIERAGLIGLSMGGMLVQVVAVEHPERVSSVTAISTSPLGSGDPLPDPDPAYLEFAATWEGLDASDTDALAAMIAADAGRLAGTRHPHDAAATRALVDRDLARARNPQSMLNHGLIHGGGSGPERGQLREIRVPFLVVHGTADPLFPIAHGQALAAAVPGARLLALEGGGHELHEGDWDEVIAALP